MIHRAAGWTRRSCIEVGASIPSMSAPHPLSAELETVPARVLADSLQAVGSKQKPAAALDLATGVDEIQHSVRDAGVDGRVQRRFARQGTLPRAGLWQTPAPLGRPSSPRCRAQRRLLLIIALENRRLERRSAVRRA